MPPSTDLPAHQAAALFDLLLHKQLYVSEVVRFNRPEGIDGYGPPFDTERTEPSTSPVLQTLLYRFIYPLPGLKSVSPVFWANSKKLLKNFAGANLSQSYEHTGLGLRRTFGTGGAALLEYPARGIFGGLKYEAPADDQYEYDLEDADDLQKAFWHLAHQCVYKDGIDQVFDKIAETSDLAQHNSMVQAAHEYILVNLASVLHHIFVAGPDAAYLRRLVSGILNLMPWMILKQSLRLGNAASMINAVTRLFLTKLSLTSFTNWVGLSNNPDDGMNLLQQIASQVFGWDIAEYQKQMEKISTTEDSPDQEHLTKFKEYVALDVKTQDKYRKRSMNESKSIVTVICEEGSLPKLEGESHTLALKYLGLCASLRDRENLSRLICKSTPDLLTQTIREGIYAYDPIIRKCHQSVDLSASCQNLEDFLKDFFSLFETPLPESDDDRDDKSSDFVKDHNATVEDIAGVLRKHQSGIHRFCHQLVKNGGDVAKQYRNYAQTAATHFKVPDEDVNSQPGSMIPSNILNAHLSAIAADLSTEDRKKVTSVLDDYAAYLSALSAVSTDRLNALIEGENPPVGPGAFLARWQTLMRAEPSTPLEPEGSGPRYGVFGKGETVPIISDLESRWKWPDVPDGLGTVVNLLGAKFQRVLGELGLQFWMVHPMQEQGE